MNDTTRHVTLNDITTIVLNVLEREAFDDVDQQYMPAEHVMPPVRSTDIVSVIGILGQGGERFTIVVRNEVIR